MLYFYKNLYSLLVFTLVDVIVFDNQCVKKMFDEMIKPLVLFTFIFQDKIVRMILFEQWCCDDILSLKMLFEQEWGEGFIYAFKLGIEGTIVECDLLNNRISFDVVVAT